MRWRENAAISSDPWKVNADPARQVGTRSDRIIPEFRVNANPVDSCCTVETGGAQGYPQGARLRAFCAGAGRKLYSGCAIPLLWIRSSWGKNYTVDVQLRCCGGPRTGGQKLHSRCVILLLWRASHEGLEITQSMCNFRGHGYPRTGWGKPFGDLYLRDVILVSFCRWGLTAQAPLP